MVQSKETALYQEDKIGNDIQHAEASASAAAGTATTYISHIDDNGITVHPKSNTNNRVEINGNGMEIFRNNESVAAYGQHARIGKTPTSNTGNVYIDENNIYIRKGGTVLSKFSANGASIGKNANNAVIDFCNGIGTIEGYFDSSEQGLYIGTAIEDNDDAILPWVSVFARETNSQSPSATHGEVNIAPGDVSLNSLTYDENDDSRQVEFHVTDTGVSILTNDTADELAMLSIVSENTESAISMRIGNSGTSYGLWSNQFAKWLIAMMGSSNAGTVYSPPIYEKTTSGGSNVRVENSTYGYLRRYVSSSKRYKKDIDDISDKNLDPNRLYDARVVQFRYLDDYLDKDDIRSGKLVDGFIAEELEEVYPICVNYEDGKAEDWEPKFLIPAMLKLIQDQHKEIEELKELIERKLK